MQNYSKQITSNDYGKLAFLYHGDLSQHLFLLHFLRKRKNVIPYLSKKTRVKLEIPPDWNPFNT